MYMYAYVHTVMHMFVLTNWLYNEYNFMRHKTKQRQQNNRPSPTLQARFERVCALGQLEQQTVHTHYSWTTNKSLSY